MQMPSTIQIAIESEAEAFFVIQALAHYRDMKTVAQNVPRELFPEYTEAGALVLGRRLVQTSLQSIAQEEIVMPEKDETVDRPKNQTKKQHREEQEKGVETAVAETVEWGLVINRKQATQEPPQKHKRNVAEGCVGVAILMKRLGKSRQTIRRMTHDGRLPKPLRDGSLNVWDKLEIDRWIKNGKFLRRGRR
jgi:predicted DNA-binding transcriptional regulator AlpA